MLTSKSSRCVLKIFTGKITNKTIWFFLKKWINLIGQLAVNVKQALKAIYIYV